MNRSRFGSASPGELLDLGHGECAFLPSPLPPRGWSVATATWPLLTEAMHELGRLDGVAINLPEPGILLRPLANREALRSSSIEGTYATPRELLLFDLPDVQPAQSDDDTNVQAWREVHNYRTALSDSSTASVIDAPLFLVRQLHRVLLTGVRGHNHTPGAFRTNQVYIGSDHRFVPPPATHVQDCLQQLEAFIKGEHSGIPPLIQAFLAHYQFETIHPFGDGNGRVGRLLMTMMIRELCGHQKPWLYLSAYFDRNKDEYIDRLFAVSATAAWDAWVDFCLRATISEAKDTFARCTKLLKLRETYRTQVADRARLPTLVDQLFINPFIHISTAKDLLNVSFPTAQRDLAQLEQKGIIGELRSQYPRTYFAHEIYNISFFEPETGVPSAEK